MLWKDFFQGLRPQVTFAQRLSNSEIQTKITRYHGAYDPVAGCRPELKHVQQKTIHLGRPSDDELLRAWEGVSDEELIDAIVRTRSFLFGAKFLERADRNLDGIEKTKDRDAEGRYTVQDILSTRLHVAALRGLSVPTT